MVGWLRGLDAHFACGAIGIAQSTYIDLARQTRDPRVARRVEDHVRACDLQA